MAAGGRFEEKLNLICFQPSKMVGNVRKSDFLTLILFSDLIYGFQTSNWFSDI